MPADAPPTAQGKKEEDYMTTANLFLCATEGGQCQCKGKVYYTPQTTTGGITLAALKALPNATMDVNGSVKCDANTFSKDPTASMDKKNKQCTCESSVPIKIHKTKFCATEGGTCACDGKVVYSSFDGFLNKDSIQSYATKAAWGGNILCTSSEFGKDPAPGQSKYCFCTTSVFKKPVVPLKTEKTQIVDGNNEPITLSCANWSGAQDTSFVPGGLDKAPADFIAKTIASLGFNCVRLPYSLQAYFSNPVVSDADVAMNPEYKGLTSMLVFDKVLKACTDNGLMVILNNHVS